MSRGVRRRAAWLWRNLEEVSGAALLAALCLFCTVQIAGRYLLRSPPSWTEELSTILLVWLTFVGASLALKKGEHFAVSVLVELLPAPLLRAARVLAWLCVVAFALVLIWYGGAMAWRARLAVTAALEVPRSVPYAAVPVCGLLMLARSIEGLVAGGWGLRKPGESGPLADAREGAA